MIAAEALGKNADAQEFRAAYSDLRSNLVTSVSWAYQHTGNGKYIPGTPFDRDVTIWGSANALYPCGFLDPLDPMMSSTLKTMESFFELGTFEIQVWLNKLATMYSQSVVRHCYVNIRSITRMAKKSLSRL